MGRHRYTASVRSDGLLATVGPLLDRRRVVAATLVDITSGFLLDGYSHDPGISDLELLGAAHAELARTAGALAGTTPGSEDDGGLVVGRVDRYHHILHPVLDPHGDLLALSGVVRGTHWHAVRAQRFLRQVSVAGLTAGPGVDRRLFAGPSSPQWEPSSAPHAAGPSAAGRPVGAPAADARTSDRHAADPRDTDLRDTDLRDTDPRTTDLSDIPEDDDASFTEQLPAVPPRGASSASPPSAMAPFLSAGQGPQR